MGAPPKSLTRYTHFAGVSTVQVAARGEMLRDAEVLSFVGRRKRDGHAEVQIDSRHGNERAAVMVDAAEFLRMASAVAALLDMNGTGTSQARLALQMRAQEYTEHVTEAMVQANDAASFAIRNQGDTIGIAKAISEAFACGFMRALEGV